MPSNPITSLAGDEDGTIAQEAHCHFCFDVLVGHLTQQPEHHPEPPFLNAHCPLFVTWNKSSSGGGYNLRGCIGTLQPQQLHTAVRDYALTSALRDTRFSPVSLREVPRLSCGVSLLRCFEEGRSWSDWDVGTHGIIIEFTDPSARCRRSATYLPEVAREQGWNNQQALDSLLRKAGYDGPVTEQLRCTVRLTRYQSSKAAVDFEDYSASDARKASLDALMHGSKPGCGAPSATRMMN